MRLLSWFEDAAYREAVAKSAAAAALVVAIVVAANVLWSW